MIEEKLQTPRVSIGMPVYNGAKYIKEAIESILNQTFTDFELIISDNASTDNTKEICNKYGEQDKRIRYIRKAENIGAIENFKYVLENANGEYFMWHAHDDKLSSPLYLSKLLIAIDPNYDVAIPDVHIVDELNTNKPISVVTGFCKNQLSDAVNQLIIKHPSYIAYSLYKRNKLSEMSKYLWENNDLQCYGEGLFAHAVAEKLQCILENQVSLIYRRHNSNASSMTTQNRNLYDFSIYTKRVFVYYIKSSYPFPKKWAYIISLIGIHARYFIILCLKIIGNIFKP